MSPTAIALSSYSATSLFSLSNSALTLNPHWRTQSPNSWLSQKKTEGLGVYLFLTGPFIKSEEKRNSFFELKQSTLMANDLVDFTISIIETYPPKNFSRTINISLVVYMFIYIYIYICKRERERDVCVSVERGTERRVRTTLNEAIGKEWPPLLYFFFISLPLELPRCRTQVPCALMTPKNARAVYTFHRTLVLVVVSSRSSVYQSSTRAVRVRRQHKTRSVCSQLKINK